MAFFIRVVIHNHEKVFLELLSLILLEVVLTPIIRVPELEFSYSYFSFQNLFLYSFQAFLEVSVLPKEFTNLGS